MDALIYHVWVALALEVLHHLLLQISHPLYARALVSLIGFAMAQRFRQTRLDAFGTPQTKEEAFEAFNEGAPWAAVTVS